MVSPATGQAKTGCTEAAAYMQNRLSMLLRLWHAAAHHIQQKTTHKEAGHLPSFRAHELDQLPLQIP